MGTTKETAEERWQRRVEDWSGRPKRALVIRKETVR